MGELKSTLDIIMEKSSHLNLSEEEKREHEFTEMQQRLKGLIQKILDRTLKMEQLKQKLHVLEKTHGVCTKEIFLEEIIDQLTIDQDDRLLLRLLQEFFEADKIVSIYNQYHDKISLFFQESISKMKERLKQKHHISGSAVKPNLNADAVWLTELQRIKDECKRMMRQEKSRMKERAGEVELK